MNPVDYKIRQSRTGASDRPVILGWDAAGIVVETGAQVKGFKIGDEVYYAGDIQRDGSNAEFQTVDHRIVAPKPKSLGFAEAAALPLTSLTAYEGLFEKLRVDPRQESSVLFIGGSGGVGSIGIQLLKTLTSAKAYSTYGREDSKKWLIELGVDGAIDRKQPIRSEMNRLGVAHFDFVFSLTHTDQHLKAIEEAIRPFGSLCLIDDPSPFDISMLKTKALTVCWELMFTKSLFQFDMESQGRILREVATLVDQGKIKTTASRILEGLSAETLLEAHRLQQSHESIGKTVVVF